MTEEFLGARVMGVGVDGGGRIDDGSGMSCDCRHDGGSQATLDLLKVCNLYHTNFTL